VVAGTYDITHEGPVVEMTQRLMQEFGGVDVLVNMAAEGARGLFFDLTEDQWDRCLAVGLKSYFLTVKHVGKEMARRGTGKIINFSSIVAIQGAAGAAPWSAARGGVDAMTRSQAQALGPYGVAVNALVRWSEDVAAADTPEKRERLRRLAFGPAGKSTDAVGAALFLASPDSDWVTGTVLYADGGYSVAAVTDAQYRPGGIDEIRAPRPYTGP
jgi:NAD(P)-dependent dehydrogenase (short-subunit alcohol dehydrogenase family)